MCFDEHWQCRCNILGNVVAFCTYVYLKGDVLGKMEEYSLILLIDCWTSFEGIFVNKRSYCWFPRDIMAASWMAGTKAFLSTGNLTLFHVNFSRKILFYYHSTWPSCHVVANEESIKDTKCPYCNNCLHSNTIH